MTLALGVVGTLAAAQELQRCGVGLIVNPGSHASSVRTAYLGHSCSMPGRSISMISTLAWKSYGTSPTSLARGSLNEHGDYCMGSDGYRRLTLGRGEHPSVACYIGAGRWRIFEPNTVCP